ncbi:metallophosphoesterase [Thermosyntropha sp.]|uniref:metallophosphoesterase family protein n=1 Tax=Thermosyntropha sp. TaxID=2740820 RepID=UPI0025F90F81|nr:metallophosphoesterase [Thermosyntropha sp.]MBO8158357.1 metallophosphoesterase family protein [Thermosyntropha sp.]
MRFLYITDTHLRGNAPKNRIDNFIVNLKNKIDEVIDLAYKYQVDYILHGGDFFDSPSPSLAAVGDFLKLFTKENFPPIYAISGNHDVFAANLNTLPRTMLGFLDKLGFLKLIMPGEKIMLEKNDITVQLTGQSYYYDIDREDEHNAYIVKKGNADIAIHMVHGMLVNDPGFPGQDFTLIDHILDTEADITLSGHNHLGFGIIEKENRLFVNPGALIRISSDKKEMSRKVSVALIKIERKKPEVDLISLTSALPGDLVLSREAIEAEAERSKKIAGFVAEISKATNLERTDAERIIEEIARAQNINLEVRKEALERISKVQERLENGERGA